MMDSPKTPYTVSFNMP